MEERPHLVTPEAVELRMGNAGLGSRLLSTLIDAFVIFILFSGLFVLEAAAFGEGWLDSSGSIAVVQIVLVIAVPLVSFGYPIFSETLWRGRTIGKLVVGLRVVTVQGAPIRFRHAVVRGLIGMVEYMFTSGVAPLVAILASRQGQRLGDMAAGTIVIRTRQVVGRSARAVTFEVPLGLEGFTQTLDVSRVDNEMYQAIRSFLLRVTELTPEARWSLAQHYSAIASRRLNVSLPNDIHPETFLVSVASARQQVGVPAVNAAASASQPPMATPAHLSVFGAGSPVAPAVAPAHLTDPPGSSSDGEDFTAPA